MNEAEKDQNSHPETPEPTSETGDQGTSPKKSKTYTEDQVTKLVNDAGAAAGATAGRLAKENKDLKAQVVTVEENLFNTNQLLSSLQAKIDDAELDDVRGDPGKLDLYQERRRLRDEAARLAREKDDLQKQRTALGTDLEAVTQFKKGKVVQETAAKALGPKADPKDIQALVATLSALNLETEEQLEPVAKALAAAQPKKQPPETPETPETPEAPEGPDSGLTTGGTGSPTAEQLEAMPMAEYAAWRKKQES